MKIPTDAILPNPDQPRRNFDAVALRELADSLKSTGLIQPIVVEEVDGNYVLLDGERRWRAARMLGWTEIEAVIRECTDGGPARERALIALTANLQRADLTITEEARGMQKLVEMGMSRVAIANRLGVSFIRVANRLEILRLDEEIQDLIDAKLIPCDRRAVAAINSLPPEVRVKFCRSIARPGLAIKAVQKAAERLNLALRAERERQEPALKFAYERAGREPHLPDWDALRQLGRVPPWKLVEASARRTCQSCVLRPQASASICRECPAVAMLAILIEEAKPA